jgi:RNA polymerase sigma factor (sigma-70 family)
MADNHASPNDVALFQTECSRVVAYLCYDGFDWHVAEESAAEAMEDAWERSIAPERRAGWIRIAAKRRALRKARNLRWNPLVRLQAKGYQSPSSGQDGTEMYRAVEQHDEIVVAMRQLTKKHRVVMMLYIDGFTPIEIAQELQMPSRTVYDRLGEARKHLRSLIEANQKEETR